MEQRADIGAVLEPLDEQILDILDQTAPFLKTRLVRPGHLLSPAGDVEVLYLHDALSDREFAAVVSSDLKWAILSFASVFAYAVFHTSSFLVSGVGMFASTAAYPVALVWSATASRLAPCRGPRPPSFSYSALRLTWARCV